MAALRRGTLYIPPFVQCRHRGKINIQRPCAGPLERRVFEAITQPIVLDRLEEPSKLCSRYDRLQLKPKEEEISQYERILRRECLEHFEKNNMIVVFHYFSIDMRSRMAIQNRLIKNDMKLKYITNSIVHKTLTGTKWENLLPLVSGKTLFVFSEEPRISSLVTDLKKIPQLVMLGGVLENRILTREGLLRAAALPAMDVLLGETCSLLSAGASRTRALLSSHQQTLSTNLQQYVRDRTEGSTDS